MKKRIIVTLVFALAAVAQAQETLSPKIPQTYEELWGGFDPRAEPLDTEIVTEWEEDGVVLRIVRYRIGIFKGQKAMMAAVYGFPKGASKLPGLVQIHGGGQYADAESVLTNAKRGYATISIAWAGRISSSKYKVNPQGVQLFWDNATDDPNYRLTTDWGALDAYHAPCRNPKNAFSKVAPAAWTLDAVDSPRNCPWFLCTLGARRALTFLEQQPEVDAGKLGVYGHSMGGKLTVLTTGADDRVKAAAPSCGGISDRPNDNVLYAATLEDGVSLKRIACPIIFLSPANDFHGRIDDLQTALTEIKSSDWRVTCAPHHNHQDTDEYEVATQLWFDQYLKGEFKFPATPESALNVKTENGIPTFTVTPDTSSPILSVDVFYTQHGQVDGKRDDFENTKTRFWRHAKARQAGEEWTAELPVLSTDKPLWAYANIVYPLDEPVTGAGYYYGTYTTKQFNLSSRMSMTTAAIGQATLKPSLMLETFEGDWQKEWFTYKPEDWPRRTHKLHDPQWQAPERAKFAIEVRSEKPNNLVIGIDDHAAEIQLEGQAKWQKIILITADFKNATGEPLKDWAGLRELRLSDKETLRNKEVKKEFGASWQGADPKFRNLRWLP
jgi:cephalosporin-C deacetylase-like acetyl esterase